MTETPFPAIARIPARALAAACLLFLGAIWLSPLLVLALATGSLAGALSRHVLTRIPHGTRAGPFECEIPTALLWTLVTFLWHNTSLSTSWLPLLLTLTWVAVPLAVVDLRHHRLPRALTIPLLVVTLPLLSIPAFTAGWQLLLRAVLGAAILHALHALIHRTNPTALGKGDVLLSAPLGAIHGALGLHTLIPATLLASLATLTLHLLTRPPRTRGTAPTEGSAPTRGPAVIPHAPGMLGATTVLALLTLALP
jgi:leader peptidase (prepilin peptidase) / N-methyltransferase